MKNLSTKHKKILFYSLLGFFALWIITSFAAIETTPAEEVPEVPEVSDKIDAWVCATNEVERNLKSPSTAKFPWSGYTAVELSDNNWAISSYVDSQNGFGAMIRTEFICSVYVLPGVSSCAAACDFTE